MAGTRELQFEAKHADFRFKDAFNRRTTLSVFIKRNDETQGDEVHVDLEPHEIASLIDALSYMKQGH